MSITIDIRKEVADGNPLVFWSNRFDPFVIGNAVTAHSGKVAVIRTSVSGSVGKPMIVAFRMAKQEHLDAWKELIDDDPFSTTSLVDYFDTGHTVIFNPKDPIKIQHEILKDEWDYDQDIFKEELPDEYDIMQDNETYRAGFDRFRGIMNLIIVT